MTYLEFHLVFILPPLLAVAFWARRWLGRPRAKLAALAVPPIALAYTTPWDNYLVWKEVWGYGPERVLATIGYVPIEEYLFFLLQPLLTGLLIIGLLERAEARLVGRPGGSRPPLRSGTIRVRAAGGVLYGIVAAAGVVALQYEQGTYMGLILAWAAPVLAGMWIWAGAEVWRRRGPVALGIAVPTLYLWLADWFAIRNGIWYISDRFTFGIDPFGLPVEEATFFLVTNILVAQGAVLFLYPPHLRPESEPDTANAGRVREPA